MQGPKTKRQVVSISCYKIVNSYAEKRIKKLRKSTSVKRLAERLADMQTANFESTSEINNKSLSLYWNISCTSFSMEFEPRPFRSENPYLSHIARSVSILIFIIHSLS